MVLMRITVTSFKGGVRKTTSAIHLAAVLQERGPTLLIDGDPNRSALAWRDRGPGLPFEVIDESEASADMVSRFRHTVIDTEAHPSREDLRVLMAGCDLLVIPTTPEVMSLHALMLTLEALHDLDADHYRVLLSIVPPKPSRDGEEARTHLKKHRIPVFKESIRRLVAFQKAALAGVLVHQAADPRAQVGWEEYRAVGKELSKR
jgi:chromosome partitioning protein